MLTRYTRVFMLLAIALLFSVSSAHADPTLPALPGSHPATASQAKTEDADVKDDSTPGHPASGDLKSEKSFEMPRADSGSVLDRRISAALTEIHDIEMGETVRFEMICPLHF